MSRVTIVTGASRGVGKGIALALGEAGYTVYVTGRSVHEGQTGPLPGTITATAAAVRERGGNSIAVACDHRNDDEIDALVARVIDEQGRVDILVNNVFAVPDDLMASIPFWERPKSHWEQMIDLGLRAHYIAACAVAPHMIRRRSGLIVNVSSPGARCYIHSPVYGIGKAGTDKMAQDIARELAEFDVAAISLWLGVVKTERTLQAMEAAPEAYAALAPGLESPEFAGRIIHALAESDELMLRTGRTWYTAELGQELGVTDVDGRQPESYRTLLGGPADPSPAMIR